MRRVTRLPLLLALAGIGVTVVATVPAAQQTPKPEVPRTIAYRDVRLIDGDGKVLATQGVLVVRGDRIEAAGPAGSTTIPAGATNVGLAGFTIMPGLINAHGHVADTQGLQTGRQFYTEANLIRQLRLYASYGVTTVLSLGGDDAAGFTLRDAQPQPARARLFVAGPVISAATPDAARAEVDRVAAMKPNVIKIRVDDNLGTTTKMPIEVARAVIEQAHKHGLKVAVHIFYLEDTKALLRAGADFIAHSVRDRPVDDELISLLKQRNVCVCPTLTREVSTFVYEKEPEFFADPFFLRSADPAILAALRDPKRQEQYRESQSAQRYKVALEQALANAKRLADAGVQLASGTDTGPPARFQGYFEHLELELLAKAGLRPEQILQAATGGAARCVADLTNGTTKALGSLRPGSLADLILLSGDPLKDIRETKTVQGVWINGQRIVN